MRLITNVDFTKEEFEKRLRYKTEPVKSVTNSFQNVAIEMLGFMYSLNAIGLAANQVGLKISLCVLDPAFMIGKKMPIVMFNPQIVEHGDELYESPEGCLSLPELGVRVPRFRKVVVKYLGIAGREHTIRDDNSLLASVLQHEIDHLHGTLMTDRLLEKREIMYKNGVVIKGN